MNSSTLVHAICQLNKVIIYIYLSEFLFYIIFFLGIDAEELNQTLLGNVNKTEINWKLDVNRNHTFYEPPELFQQWPDWTISKYQ